MPRCFSVGSEHSAIGRPSTKPSRVRKDALCFFLSLFLSRLADQIILFVVPLVVFKTTDSAAWAGLAFFAESLPRFLSFPVCGALYRAHLLQGDSETPDQPHEELLRHAAQMSNATDLRSAKRMYPRRRLLGAGSRMRAALAAGGDATAAGGSSSPGRSCWPRWPRWRRVAMPSDE